jgi:hypothetical protein
MTLHCNQLIGFGAGGRPGVLQFVGGTTERNGSGGTISSVATTGLTGGIDTEARQGDLIIVAWACSGTSNLDLSVSGSGLSFTEVAELYSNDIDDINLSVNWAHCDVSPPATITLTGTGTAEVAAIMVFREHDTVTPMDATPTTATGLNGVAADPPSITPATTGAIVVAIGALASGIGADSAAFTAAPTNYDDLTENDSASGSQMASVGMAYRTDRTAGVAENPGAFTTSSAGDAGSSWAAVTLAIRPAALV